MDKLQAILAKNLRQARARVGISQEDLAGEAKVDRTYVSGIERGLRNPTISILVRFAKVLKTDVVSLLTKDAFSKK